MHKIRYRLVYNYGNRLNRQGLAPEVLPDALLRHAVAPHGQVFLVHRNVARVVDGQLKVPRQSIGMPYESEIVC